METIAFTLGEAYGAKHDALRSARSSFVRIVVPDISSVPVTVSDEELFEQFLAGDERAFTLLFERHNRKLYYYCAKMLQDAQAAEDITQAMWERIIDLRTHPTNVRNVAGFFVRIVRNLALDHIKHRKFQTPLDSLSESETVGNEISEREQIVLDSLEALDPKSRELLILHYYSGYSFEEIAAMTNKKANAVWTQASRARHALKGMIEQRLGTERER